MTGEQPLQRYYRQALQHFLVVHHLPPDVLRVHGEDRLDFLNRMSTQALLDLGPGRTATTVFTNAIGRIVDVARVLSREDHALLVTAHGRAQALRDWLQRYIFFQDRVSIETMAGSWAHLGIYGPQALQAGQALAPELGALAPGDHAELPDGAVWAVRRPQPGLEFALQGEAARRAQTLWSPDPAQAQAYQALRIESGLPIVGQEITERAIPLEVGLWEAVSFSKGCYIGQEVIARMESRGRQARRLLGVQLEGPAQPGAPLHQGAAQQGHLTSIALSPRHGWIGLAVVRPAALQAEDGRVQIGEDGGSGQLVELPFN